MRWRKCWRRAFAKDSSLAKVRKEGVIRVGYSQTGPWFYKDAKSGELGGIYKDAVDRLAKEMEVKVDYKEVTFQNSTVGLRRNDYDLYGSSLTYTLARALVVDYVGPLWSKGSLLMVHKDNAGRFKTLADFNDPKVTFSLSPVAARSRAFRFCFRTRSSSPPPVRSCWAPSRCVPRKPRCG
jgi:ABC-type amino acid transport substrate-binding protein